MKTLFGIFILAVTISLTSCATLFVLTSYSISFNTTPDGAGILLLGGIIGMLIVDPLSGAMYKIAKEDRAINETLEPVSNEYALQVYDINNLPNGVNKDDLVRIN